MKIDIATFPNRVFIKGARNSFVTPFITKIKNDENFFQNTLLATMIIKSVFKSIVYIMTSLNAKDAPEDQRKLAASISLTNGLISLIAMGTVGNIVNKHSGPWADKVFSSLKHNTKMHNLAKLGFRSFLTIGITGVFIQKFLVQYLSIPLAKWLKKTTDHKPFPLQKSDLKQKTL